MTKKNRKECPYHKNGSWSSLGDGFVRCVPKDPALVVNPREADNPEAEVFSIIPKCKFTRAQNHVGKWT